MISVVVGGVQQFDGIHFADTVTGAVGQIVGDSFGIGGIIPSVDQYRVTVGSQQQDGIRRPYFEEYDLEPPVGFDFRKGRRLQTRECL